MKNLVSFQEWMPWYRRIAAEFDYDSRRDQLATDILSRLLVQRSIKPRLLEHLVHGKPVLVFGAGPSLEQNLQKLADSDLLRKFLLFSADGATTALLQIPKVIPSVVISDLDGDIRYLLHANQLGSLMTIHGHGDNIVRLKRYVPRLRNVLGTTQVEPRPRVHNFGGFTDGDRAAFLAATMGAKMIVLAGMDLGQVVGKYSKRRVRQVQTKTRKLKICKELLEWLASKVAIPLYNVTRHGETIDGFADITSDELARIVA